jgi:hypothetical protein
MYNILNKHNVLFLKLLVVLVSLSSLIALGNFVFAQSPEIQMTPLVPPPPDQDMKTRLTDIPPAPVVSSPVFLDPESWYNTTEGVFTWTLPPDVYAVAVEIATSTDQEPTTVFNPAVESFKVNKDIVKEGEQYLSVQFRNEFGWGDVEHRKLRIDTTPPERFSISVQPAANTTDFPLLRFFATDLISGVVGYEIVIRDREPVRVTSEEVKIGYKLKDLENGSHTIKVIAIDSAGNTQESLVEVMITAGWVAPTAGKEKAERWNYFTVLSFFLIALVGFLCSYIWCQKKDIRQKELKLRKETKEIQDQTEKIFSALRDEIYEQISTITKSKRLSKKERTVVDGLTQALEVSESLIEKEIGDVKTILK